MTKTNANDRIQAAMRKHEAYILREVRKANRQGRGFEWPVYSWRGMALYHAEDRLKERGIIFYNRRGTWRNPRRGLWLRSAWDKAVAK